jgi:hypothetical protein
VDSRYGPATGPAARSSNAGLVTWAPSNRTPVMLTSGPRAPLTTTRSPARSRAHSLNVSLAYG